jgi:outer membrane protein OmpA-like peptidoglycan-associated protein
MTRLGRIAAVGQFVLVSAALTLTAVGALAADAGDHPLVGRYEGAELLGRWDNAFDEPRIVVAPFDPVNAFDRSGEAFQTVEGRSFLFYYALPEGRSSLEVLRNYETSLKAKGFVVLFACATSDGSCFVGGRADSGFHLGYGVGDPLDLPRLRDDYVHNAFEKRGRYLLARLERGDGAVYASISLGENARGGVAIVRVVETKPMDAGKIVVVDAKSMGAAIDKDGRVNLYGLYFDFDSDKLKVDSKPTLDEIAKLLRERPALALDVVGHTDSMGAAGYNMDLSARRAASVVRALTQDYGIAAARLSASGAGAASPVASNADESGRAKNRRVELVAR